MKKHLINIFAILCCVAAFAYNGRAAAGNRSEFQIPFTFMVGNQKLPAGKYSVERLNPANPDVLILKQIGGKIKTVFQTRRIGGEKPTAEPRMTFNRRDEGFILSGIWESGENYGYRVLSNEGAH